MTFAAQLRLRLGMWEEAWRQPLRDASYVVLDTELTGLDRRADKIISIGAVRMRGTRILVGETFYRWIDPERAMARENVLVHRLLPGELATQNKIQDALHALVEFIGEAIVVGHFVALDMAFLRRAEKKFLYLRWLDTMQILQWHEHAARGYDIARTHGAAANDVSLYALAERLNIPVQAAHDALYDAYLTAQVWQQLVPQLENEGLRRVGDALRVGGG